MEFTARELEREARREVGQREHVYKRLVEAGKLTQQKADRQIALMRAIADRLKEIANTEDAQKRLPL